MLENNEIKEEIASRFDKAISNGEDELDVYSEMLEKGIDVDTVRKCCGRFHEKFLRRTRPIIIIEG